MKTVERDYAAELERWLAGEKVKFSGNQEHLNVLKESIRRRSARYWNKWRGQNPQVVPNLQGVQLFGNRLRGCNLSGAKLDNAGLEHVDLAGADLERASLREAEFLFVNLSSVHAARADFSSADFHSTTLSGGNFQRAKFLADSCFYSADLDGADFSGAKLAHTSFNGSNLTDTCFDGADLRRASFSDAILNGTSFRSADLREALLDGCFIRKVQTDSKTKQQPLTVDVHVVWERPRGKVIDFAEVDDIHLAQFHDIVGEHGAVANLISACSRRVAGLL